MSQADQHHRIDYIEFPATDLDATKRFYGNVFGWVFQDWGPDYASFQDGRMNGGFWTESKPQSGAGPLVVLYSANLEQTLKAVEAAGAKVVKPIFNFPGGRRFGFLDPNGNELAVWGE